MLGALVGDIVGSVFERAPHKSKEFDFISEKSRFTDDSVLTLATADAILHGYGYMEVFKYWGRCYPNAGYGDKFFRWCLSDEKEQGESFGNGSAMRVSPVAWAFDTLDEVLAEAKKSAEPSHNHPDGIKGASAVAAAIFLARTGKSKDEIKEYVEKEFGYDLSRTVGKIRRGYKFDATCPGSVPEALIAFLDSDSFEDALRNAVSLGGDSDTQACIAGAVAEAFYGPISEKWVSLLNVLLPQEAIKVAEEFNKNTSARATTSSPAPSRAAPESRAKTARRTICSGSTRRTAAGGCALPRRTKRSGPSPPAPAKNPAPSSASAPARPSSSTISLSRPSRTRSSR